MKIGMSFFVVLASFSLFACCGNVFGQDVKWAGNCDVSFFGKSTLHNFSGSVKAKSFTVLTSNLKDKANAKATGKVTVKASKMVTGNKKRDANMYKSLAATTFPNIVVEISDLRASSTKPVMDGPVPRPTVIPFTLYLKGKKQKMIGKVSNWSYSDTVISYTISFPVSLKASGIEVPSILGVVKVADEIQVKAKLTLRKK